MNLYFAEIWSGALASGKRVFDVIVEDQILKLLDVYSEAGGYTALKKTFFVNSDQHLNITLQRKIQNPAIKAIEIIQLVSDEEANSGVAQPDTTESIADTPANNNSTLVDEAQEKPHGFHTSEDEPENDKAVGSDEISTKEVPLIEENKSDASNSGISYRFNAGGPAIEDPVLDWGADSSEAGLPSTGEVWSTNHTVNTSHISAAVPEKLFSSERWDPAGGENLKWSLPVQPGNYKVNLYFAEIWDGAMASGKRVFHVKVENQEVLNLDVYAEVGGFNALVKTFYVSADSTLDIELLHKVQNPSIKGVEIISLQ